MELKEFIKSVLIDITSAVKESQVELNNGALIVPDNVIGLVRSGNKPLSLIEFEVAITTEDVKEKGKGIKIASAILNGGYKDDNKNSAGCVSTIKFSIPVVLPCIPTK